jgi:hypothetical protein
MSQPRLRIVRDREEGALGLDEPLSFDAFFAAESQTLFRRMWLVTRDRHEAEEIVQDAFLSLYERWERAPSWDDPTSYLYRTAFNMWKKRTRRAARPSLRPLLRLHRCFNRCSGSTTPAARPTASITFGLSPAWKSPPTCIETATFGRRARSQRRTLGSSHPRKTLPPTMGGYSGWACNRPSVHLFHPQV